MICPVGLASDLSALRAARASEAYGRIRAELESMGEMIGNYDLWIASHALAAGLTLVTNNERESRRVRGLRVGSWAA
jgi:tRNA(fMet)-specific endonuclease VapC